MSLVELDTTDPHETLSATEHGEHHEHITPFWTMLWVFVILLVLTALTVWSSNIHVIPFGNSPIDIGGTMHIFMALGIAIIKAVLVAAFFMHLKYDKPMNTVIVGATIFAVILFIGLTLHDSARRQKFERGETQVIIPGGTLQIVQQAIDGAHQSATNPDHAASAPEGDGHETAPEAPPAPVEH